MSSEAKRFRVHVVKDSPGARRFLDPPPGIFAPKGETYLPNDICSALPQIHVRIRPRLRKAQARLRCELGAQVEFILSATAVVPDLAEPSRVYGRSYDAEFPETTEAWGDTSELSALSSPNQNKFEEMPQLNAPCSWLLYVITLPSRVVASVCRVKFLSHAELVYCCDLAHLRVHGTYKSFRGFCIPATSRPH